MIRNTLIALVPALFCGACMQNTADKDAAMPEPVPPLGKSACSTEGLDSLTGQKGTPDLAAKALRMSGAKTVRWRKPGMAVTMDYRTDRLNIDITRDNMVTGFACG